jgi:hypothetical protein
MNKVWLGALGLAVIPLLLGCTPSLIASADALEAQTGITLRSASNATIAFTTQNGQTVDGVPPQTSQIPHLVLYRNGMLTPADERTLIVEVGGIEIPPAGITVSLSIETQHSDPDNAESRIPVWDMTLWLPNTSAVTRTDGSAVFTVEFPASIISGDHTLPTPTDYFRYRVVVILAESNLPGTVYEADYAFLLENQIVAALPHVQEITEGAAPDELVVYYCDMSPFQHRTAEGVSRLRRAEITNYVQTELAPRMVEAFRAQTDDWGFPWDAAWIPYREDETECLSVTLSDGKTWFHGPAPASGGSGISINVGDLVTSARYAGLTAQIMALYQHELFHNLQRNLALQYGGKGDVAGQDRVWQFFSEGTAVLAASVGESQAEFTDTSAYVINANNFIGGGKLAGELNTRYQDMRSYASAAYWRFLYEQCGSMQVIRQALIALYTGDIVDIWSSTDIASAMPLIMDRALAGTGCPFSTYRNSLVAFARSLYALHVQGGRCMSWGESGICGLYDPNHLYSSPMVSQIAYTGVPLIYTGTSITSNAPKQPHTAGIPSSFGIDFLEIDLAGMNGGQALTLEVYGEPEAAAEFRVQVWALGGERGQSVPVGETLTLSSNAQGHWLYTFPALDTGIIRRLAVILTRVDTQEQVDPVGAYTVTLY